MLRVLLIQTEYRNHHTHITWIWAAVTLQHFWPHQTNGNTCFWWGGCAPPEEIIFIRARFCSSTKNSLHFYFVLERWAKKVDSLQPYSCRNHASSSYFSFLSDECHRWDGDGSNDDSNSSSGRQQLSQPPPQLPPLSRAPLSPPTSHLRGNLENLCYLRDLSLLSERAPCRRTAVSLNLNVSHFVRTISIQYSNQKEKFGNRVSRILRVPTLCNKWTFELDSVVNELLESNREQMIAF